MKTASEVLCLANDKGGALNVYFVPDLIKISDGDTSSLCGYAYMGDNSKDRVFMDVDCSTNGSTLLHEFGHYFSHIICIELPRWEELVDGSNCRFAGDGFFVIRKQIQNYLLQMLMWPVCIQIPLLMPMAINIIQMRVI